MAKKMAVQIGMRFRSVYADANALWEVKQKRGRGTWLCEIVNEPVTIDGKVYNGDYANVKKAFLEEDIAAAVWSEQRHQKSMDQTADFYGSLQEGAIVHYHNGFNQYVRCRVVTEDGEHMLLPIALVGEWQKWDLPKRNPDGEIYLGYHAKSIVEKRTMQPHGSNVFESPQFARLNAIDPTHLPALSLEVPELDEKQAKRAGLVKAIRELHDILEQDGEPLDIIKRVYARSKEIVGN